MAVEAVSEWTEVENPQKSIFFKNHGIFQKIKTPFKNHILSTPGWLCIYICARMCVCMHTHVCMHARLDACMFAFVLYCIVLYCIVLYCIVLYCTVLYCTVLYCTVLYCTVLYCTVLYCTVLYCTVCMYVIMYVCM